jgi:hypothetical protein
MNSSGSKRKYVIVKRWIRTDATGGITTGAMEEMKTGAIERMTKGEITDKDSRRTSIKNEFSVYQEGASRPLLHTKVILLYWATGRENKTPERTNS